MNRITEQEYLYAIDLVKRYREQINSEVHVANKPIKSHISRFDKEMTTLEAYDFYRRSTEHNIDLSGREYQLLHALSVNFPIIKLKDITEKMCRSFRNVGGKTVSELFGYIV